jgi:hypothetical protein
VIRVYFFFLFPRIFFLAADFLTLFFVAGFLDFFTGAFLDLVEDFFAGDVDRLAGCTDLLLVLVESVVEELELPPAMLPMAVPTTPPRTAPTGPPIIAPTTTPVAPPATFLLM